MEKETKIRLIITVASISLFIAFIVGMAAVIPRYNVYKKTLNGRALLQEAEYTRQIAELDAMAEISRARGVAASDSIISGGLKGETEYLTYLWIEALKSGSCEVIYVPNDGSLPILEATRLGNP